MANQLEAQIEAPAVLGKQEGEIFITAAVSNYDGENASVSFSIHRRIAAKNQNKDIPARNQIEKHFLSDTMLLSPDQVKTWRDKGDAALMDIIIKERGLKKLSK